MSALLQYTELPGRPVSREEVLLQPSSLDRGFQNYALTKLENQLGDRFCFFVMIFLFFS